MSEQNSAPQQPQQHFEIQKLYTKDISFETPNSPMIFTEQWTGESQLQLHNESAQLADNIHEVVLTVTVTTKQGDKTAYLCEVRQAGIFTIAGFAPDQLAAMLGAYCPNVLFPYAREAVSNLDPARRLPAAAARAGELRRAVHAAPAGQAGAADAGRPAEQRHGLTGLLRLTLPRPPGT